MPTDSRAEGICFLAAGLAGAVDADRPAVLVEKGRVTALGSEALALAGEVRDLSPWFLCPAPIDPHVHLYLLDKPEANLLASRAAGLAAVRDLGCKVRAPWPRPVTGGARLVAAGPGLGKAWLSQALCGPDDFRRAAWERVRAGAGVLKIFGTGLLDFGHPGRVEDPRNVSLEEMAAVVAVGRAAGRKVAIHANGRAAVRDALEAGVDSIEHGYFLAEEDFRRMAGQGVAWSPTLAAIQIHARDPQGRHDQTTRDNLAAIAQGQERAMLLAVRLGVNLVLGSDAGSYCLPHGEGFFTEMASWLSTGVPAPLVFQAGAAAAAEQLGLAGEIGVIKPGALACLLGVEEDPRQNPLTMSQPRWRFFPEDSC